jgi:hypothetical protein
MGVQRYFLIEKARNTLISFILSQENEETVDNEREIMSASYE